MSSDSRNNSKKGVPKSNTKLIPAETNVTSKIYHGSETKSIIPDRSPGFSNRKTDHKNSEIQNSSNPTGVSSQKTSTSDRLSSLFYGSQENKRPILRVNLIKKSNKQTNLSNLNSSRRLQTNRIRNTPAATVPLDDKGCQKSNVCQVSLTETEIHGERDNSRKEPEGISDKSDRNEEARKSQKLVVSLIKDISKTVSNESFIELSKEIQDVIGKIQQEKESSLKTNDKVGAPISSNSSRSPIKKRQSDQVVSSRKETSISSDASNSSEPREINHSEYDTSIDNYPRYSKHDIKRSTRTGANQSLDDKIGENSTRYNLRKQLMDLSSDDDTGGEFNRKPNSSRLPERCLRLTSSHAKYISPHRKRSLEERLSRAQEAREKFLEYRANKFRDILKKVEEVRTWKEEDSMNLKAALQTKLQKAAVKRKEQLDRIIRKAHDEDSKVSEIQFINNLEAQNRRHDMNSRKKEFEARLQDLQDERQRRFEEKQAKEAAAEERRKTLEAERKAKLLEIQKRRRIKNQKVEQQQQVREKKRIEKNRHREQKISAIKEAYHAGVQTLKKRINQKQEQSERRHEVNLRLIRQKAFELSIKRYNSFVSESNALKCNSINLEHSSSRQKDSNTSDTRRLQLKPFNTKKFCNLCKETISTELALFSHLRSDAHHSSINEHYGNTMLTTNEAVEIHNLRHIVDTDEPAECDKGANSDDHQSSRASSLVNYYHSPYLSQANGGICMSESDRDSLLAIERKCRKLRHKLIAAGKPFNRDWFVGKIRVYLAQLIIKQRIARHQTTNTDATSLANTIDLSANNAVCQQNKPFYLKMNRIARELISVTMDQRISGGGLMPAGIIHSVDRLLADLNKQLASRKVPQLPPRQLIARTVSDQSGTDELDIDQLSMVTKMIESHAIDTLFLYDIVAALVIILRRIVPNVSLTSKLPSTVASHYSTLIDPISLNSYYCHRSPVLPARIYIKIIGMLQNLCENQSDLCYIIFQSNNMISLSDILSYRLGFIIGNESPASSISGSSSAATLSAHTIDRKQAKMKQQSNGPTVQTKPFNAPATVVKSASATTNRCPAAEDCLKLQSEERSNAPRKGRSSSNHPGEESTEDDEDGNDGGAGGDDDDDDDDQDESENNDQDLWNQAETYKRTEDIVDDMTAGLCKLLATLTETILTWPLVLLNKLDKGAFDQRSHDFISYMVSVGIVDTESVIMSHIHQQQHHQLVPADQLRSSLVQPDSAEHSAAAAATNLPASAIQTNLAAAAASSCAQNQSNGEGSQANGAAVTALGSPVSASNKIINFTTCCIQFVTSLVKLVGAKLPERRNDIGLQPGEQQQEDNTQLLATLKMTQLSGVLTLVYDMLVHSFNSLQEHYQHYQQQQQQQQQLNTCAKSSGQLNQLNLALHSLRLVNYVAYIDIRLLQETLRADEMLPLQLRHVCSYLIGHLVCELEPAASGRRQAPVASAQVAASAAKQQQQGEQISADEQRRASNLKSELLNEIILLLGHFAYLNETNQLMLKSGSRPTIIEQLVGLPFDFFSRPHLKLVLMPTLISCAHLNEQICALISQELSLTMLTSFIEDQLLAAQVESSAAPRPKLAETLPAGEQMAKNLALANELTGSASSSRWRFERRFAKSKWLGAKKYFEAQQAALRRRTAL